MKIPERMDYLLFGGTFLLANKLQLVGDNMVEGLSSKQWFLMRNIQDLPAEPPPTITEIARVTDSTRQNTAKMLAAMEREGLITIEREAADRRSRRVRITETGFAHARQVTENGEAFLKRLFDGIAQEKLDVAGRVILQMIDNLYEMQEEINERKS